MSFYNPMQAGPDIGGGIMELMNQFMMMKMIEQMYPGKGGKKDKETLRGMPKIGEMFLGETDLPPAQEMPPELMGQLPMGGQPPMGQRQPDIQQILQMMQMFGGLPGTPG